MTEQEQVNEILAEARAYGLEWEVQEWAHKYLEEGHEIVEAYQMGFNVLQLKKIGRETTHKT